MLKAIHATEELDAGARQALSESVLRCGTLQLLQLDVISAGIMLAPTLDDRAGALERAREALLQLEQASALYRDLAGIDLLLPARPDVMQLALPGSWVEVAIAQLVIALAAHAALEQQLRLTGGRRQSALYALATQTEHGNAARAALEELDAFSPAMHGAVRSGMDRLQQVAFAVLDDPALRHCVSEALERVSSELGLGVTH